MPRITFHANAFELGELSESSLAALQMQSAAMLPVRTAINVIPHRDGGYRDRPGTFDRNANVPVSDVDWVSPGGNSRIEPFVFDLNERYIFLLQPSAIHIFNADDGVKSTIAPSATTPFVDPWLVSMTDQGNVAVLTSRQGAIILRRTGLNTWAKEDLFNQPNQRVPFLQFHDGSVTLTPSATTGSITITASEDYFVQAHEDNAIKFQILGSVVTTTTFNSATSITATVDETLPVSRLVTLNAGQRVYDFKIDELVTHSRTGALGIVRGHTTGVQVQTISGDWPTTAPETGDKILGTESKASQLIFSIAAISPLSVLDWQEQAFSAHRGWPRAARFHANRLWLGGHQDVPPYLTGSKVGRYFDFNTGDNAADDAISLVITGDSLGEIVSLQSERNLLVIMTEEFGYIPTISGVTPANARYRFLDKARVCQCTRPIWIGTKSLVLHNDGFNAKTLEYIDDRGYVVEDVTEWIGGFDAKVLQMAVWNDEESKKIFGVAVMENGDIKLGWPNAADDRISWVTWQTAGDYESAASVGEKLFLLTERQLTLLPPPELFLEQVDYARWMDLQGTANHVSHNIYDVTIPTYDSEVLNYLDDRPAGVAVTDIGRTESYGNISVAPGSNEILIPVGHEPAQVAFGLEFDGYLETLSPDVMAPYVVTSGEFTQLVSAAVRVKNSRYVKINNQAIVDATGVNGPFSGEEKEYLIEEETDPQVWMDMPDNLPFHLTALAITADFEGSS